MVAVPHVGFATTSNDGTVKLRDQTGFTLSTSSHEVQGDDLPPFILDVAYIPSMGGEIAPGLLVSCGEDGSLLVTSTVNMEPVQSIPHPSSLWCVCALPDGDFVTGGHDGTMRLFSRQSSKTESATAVDQQAQFAAAVAAAREAKSKAAVAEGSGGKGKGKGASREEIGKFSKWSERQRYRGSSDGDVRVFNKEGKGIATQWSVAANDWVIIGEVLCSEDEQSNADPSANNVINGVLYDHVMPVEIDTVQGPMNLSLGYNDGENPFVAARRFIDENMLDVGYQKQIADWIMDRMGRPAVPMLDMGSSAATRSFPSAEMSSTRAPSVFPSTALYVFDDIPGGLKDKMLSKIHSLSTGYAAAASQEPVLDLNVLAQLLDVLIATSRYHATTISAAQLRTLAAMSAWRDEDLFPALDLLRLVCLHPEGSNALTGGAGARQGNRSVLDIFVDRAIRILRDVSSGAASTLTAAKLLCNLFKVQSASDILELNNGGRQVLEASEALLFRNNSSKQLRLIVVSLLANIGVSTTSRRQPSGGEKEACTLAVSLAIKALTQEQESADLVLRGALFLGSTAALSLLTLDEMRLLEIKSALERWETRVSDRGRAIFSELRSLLQIR